MRYILTIALATLLVATAHGEPVNPRSNRRDAGPHSHKANPACDSREGGEDIATAIEIPGDVSLLPYYDSGATCDNLNDYDEICLYSGSTAPDVVYRWTPSEDVYVTIDLCASAYDTKVYVYDATLGLLACNDDAGCGYSGWQSRTYPLALTGGTPCFVVVDGYGQSCGSYDLLIEATPPCVVDCAAGAMIEGEQGCYNDYDDDYDGGCYGAGWVPLSGDEQGCATVCGTGCTYVHHGLSYRDSDWYEATASGGPVTFSCEAEFPLYIAIWGANCSTWDYAFTIAPPCTPAEVHFGFPTGVEVWLVVSPAVFWGIPESDYVFTVCGLEAGPTPVRKTSWGRIKNRYRRE